MDQLWRLVSERRIDMWDAGTVRPPTSELVVNLGYVDSAYYTSLHILQTLASPGVVGFFCLVQFHLVLH